MAGHVVRGRGLGGTGRGERHLLFHIRHRQLLWLQPLLA